jgi:hypothetical protein
MFAQISVSGGWDRLLVGQEFDMVSVKSLSSPPSPSPCYPDDPAQKSYYYMLHDQARGPSLE